MAEILIFPGRTQALAPEPCAAEAVATVASATTTPSVTTTPSATTMPSATILFFTGVRYERITEPVPAEVKPTRTKPGPTKPRGRRRA